MLNEILHSVKQEYLGFIIEKIENNDYLVKIKYIEDDEYNIKKIVLRSTEELETFLLEIPQNME